MKIRVEDVFSLADTIHKVLNGEADAEETKKYEQWLASEDGNRGLVENAVDGRTIAERYRERQSLNPDQALQKIRAKTANANHRRKRIRQYIPYTAAAIVAGAIATLYFGYLQNTGMDIRTSVNEPTLTVESGETLRLLSDRHSSAMDKLNITAGDNGISYGGTAVEDANPVIHKLDIPVGHTYNITLPDGSRVWLNAGSRLRYPVPFSDGSRTVILSGEAYFEVARIDSLPFKVIAKNAEVIVLGTKFNITAYDNEETATTTLVDGAVECSTDFGSVRLIPGQQAVAGDGGISISEVDPAVFTSWTTGVFVFESMSLTDICTRLTRWYGIEFEFKGDTGNEKFSGGAWMNAPLRDFLDNIELVTEVKFTQKRDKITVTPR